MSWVLTFFTGVFTQFKTYLWLIVGGVFSIFIVWFIWRGYEISGLQVKLAASQKAMQDYQNQITTISQLREQELKTQKEANKRADEIRQTPKKDDGAIAPILLNSLQRL